MDGPYIKDVLLKKLLFLRLFFVLIYLGRPKTLAMKFSFRLGRNRILDSFIKHS